MSGQIPGQGAGRGGQRRSWRTAGGQGRSSSNNVVSANTSATANTVITGNSVGQNNSKTVYRGHIDITDNCLLYTSDAADDL